MEMNFIQMPVTGKNQSTLLFKKVLICGVAVNYDHRGSHQKGSASFFLGDCTISVPDEFAERDPGGEKNQKALWLFCRSETRTRNRRENF